MKISVIVLTLIALAALASCAGRQSGVADAGAEELGTEGNDMRFIPLDGGAMTMGTRPDGRRLNGADDIHEVLLDGFAISETPVDQAGWKEIMGKNPSSKVDPNLPVDMVSYKDCKKFLAKLSKSTGCNYFIPTEAQLEYAYKSGAIKETGLREWTADNYGDTPKRLTVNPTGPKSGNAKVVRTPDSRESVADYTKAPGLTFRLAVSTSKPCDRAIVDAIEGKNLDREQVSSYEKIEVAGVTFDMVGIEGGKFRMGATEEQGSYGDDTEKPVTEREVAGFELGRTEVTVSQWNAVMGSLPYGNYLEDADFPVINVSWYDAQLFILKLNSLSGRKFRLPSEEEWEYAARGGSKSRHYRYSGGNEVSSVAVCEENNKSLKVRKVCIKLPNELGLVDMSGNAWEWCQDTYSAYGSAVSADDADAWEWKVMRGGSAASAWRACRVSNRSRIPASNVKSTFGFRLAL